MTVTTEAAAGADAITEEKPASGADSIEEVDTSINGEEGGVTPDEIAEVLKGTGRNVPTSAATDVGDGDSVAGDHTEEKLAPPEADITTDAPEEKPVVPKPTTPEKPVDGSEVAKLTIEVEDAEGKKHEISSIEDLPDDFVPKSNKQGLEILDKLQDLKAKQVAADKETADTTEKAAREERVAKIQEGWQSEFKELGVTTQEGQDKIFAYMRTENAKRAEQGRPMIASIEDAKNGMDAVAMREAAAAADKVAKEEARRKGSLVGGGSAPGGTSAPVYRGGARNAVDAAKKMNLF